MSEFEKSFTLFMQMFGPGIYFVMNINLKNVGLKRSTTSF